MKNKLSGSSEGKDYHTDGGGIPGNSKQGTMRSPPKEGGGKPASEYGKPGPGHPKGTRGKPSGSPEAISRMGFTEPA